MQMKKKIWGGKIRMGMTQEKRCKKKKTSVNNFLWERWCNKKKISIANMLNYRLKLYLWF